MFLMCGNDDSLDYVSYEFAFMNPIRPARRPVATG